MKSLIPKTRLLGTDVMRITGSAFDWRHENHREHIDRLPMYKEAVKIAEDHGVRLAAENHIDYTADEMLEMIEAVDSPNFGITLIPATSCACWTTPSRAWRSWLLRVLHPH